MDVILLGPPGAGKGVQATMLIDASGLTHVSTGELLRRHRDEGTDLGHKAARYMATGRLVPDALVIEMILEVLANAPGGLLLDGFPRTLAQAHALDEAWTAHGRTLSGTVLLEVPDDVIVERLAGRGREDDDRATVTKRLEVYRESTEPLIGYYEERGLLHRIDGAQAPAEVHAAICRSLGVAPAASRA
jgi:adenylate kinase